MAKIIHPRLRRGLGGGGAAITGGGGGGGTMPEESGAVSIAPAT